MKIIEAIKSCCLLWPGYIFYVITYVLRVVHNTLGLAFSTSSLLEEQEPRKETITLPKIKYEKLFTNKVDGLHCSIFSETAI